MDIFQSFIAFTAFGISILSIMLNIVTNKNIEHNRKKQLSFALAAILVIVTIFTFFYFLPK